MQRYSLIVRKVASSSYVAIEEEKKFNDIYCERLWKQQVFFYHFSKEDWDFSYLKDCFTPIFCLSKVETANYDQCCITNNKFSNEFRHDFVRFVENWIFALYAKRSNPISR